MKFFFALLKTLNPFALIYLILSLLFLRFFVILPFFNLNGCEPTFTNLYFIILIIAILFLSIAGNFINQYFNIIIDNKNKIIKNSKILSILFYIFVIVGSLMGIFISYKVGNINLSSIFIVSSISIWYYSFKYKRIFIWGNISLSLLYSIIFILPWLFEFFSTIQNPSIFIECRKALNNIKVFSFISFVVIFFSHLVYSFSNDFYNLKKYNLQHNLKDISRNEKTTKLILTILFLIFLGFLILLQFQLLKNNISYFSYLTIFGFNIPILYQLYLLWNNNKIGDLKLLKLLSKSMIFITLLFIVVFYYSYFLF